MIGRYANQRNFKELLNIREFYLMALGSLLILFSYFLEPSFPLLASVLALCAVAVLGGPIIWGAVTGLMQKQMNVDELVSLAIIASVAAGEYLSAAIVAFIMVLGSLLEKFTSQRARSAIQSLIRLSPAEASVLQDGVETVLPLGEIKAGDLVVIRSGERVPVDGVVMKGTASINQASLTGESLPVEKSVDDPVFAGSISYTGMLVVRVEKVGEDTTLGKLIRLVHEAEQLRAPVLRVADKYARYFTPFIVGLSILVYLISGDMYRSITVLIVGCPCAFILAAPTAVTAALGNAAKNGILIKNGASLEELGRIDATVFDKTGTLTKGEPVVEEIIPLNGKPEKYILSMAASAEKYSEHPLAGAVFQAAERSQSIIYDAENFRQIPGQGIEAMVENKKIFVGTAPTGADHPLSEMTAKTYLTVKEDDQPIGYLGISDEIRSEAKLLVPALNRLGINKVVLLSGDRRTVAEHIAQITGIKELDAELLPEQKLDAIRKLQEQKYKVIMVGDGINDAPSLTTADIGIAMGAMGTDVAIESADIALMADDLTKIPYVIKLGQATLKTINYNIMFALVFNLLAILASSMGYLSPVLGAVTHNVGSVFVAANSAKLIRKKFLLK
ncbi:heavy metal translocating P-type ATPase [Candidatus Formimonas warabiya]|uniref:Cd(2+)-exporting ATPase n=1 Tax=Formimonas warabiya TaxID=1761012 RepID=A0A3G1KYI3_FORW1|nr:cation-translocating P-type ATPase [Candidatus Formimonas warabiya]ATW27470.1 ATPase P [Candidatus Formimonas warabiya]